MQPHRFPRFRRTSALIAICLSLLCLTTLGSRATAQLSTTHPRLWFTPADLPAIQARYNASDPTWLQGLKPRIDHAIDVYDTIYFPGGVPAVPFPDDGDVNDGLYRCEADALFFAFLSLADPNTTNQLDYAQRSRRLLMYAVDAALPGQAANTPFRAYQFPIWNRARWWGESWGLTVDWIQYHPGVLTASDKAKIQQLYLRWANDIHTGFFAPQYIPATGRAGRVASNNYYSGTFRNLLMMSLCLDDADDPVVDSGHPINYLGNTLRSYRIVLRDEWMARLSTIYLHGGSCSGGYHPEGLGYGLENMGFLSQAWLAMKSSGFSTAAECGSYADVIDNDPFIDDIIDSTLQSIARGPSPALDHAYLGDVCMLSTYGDSLRGYLLDEIALWGPLYELSKRTGRTDRLEKLRWLAMYTGTGGRSRLWNRASNIFESVYTQGIMYFFLLDPAMAEPNDPRPSLPTYSHSSGFGRVIARDNWSASHRLFTYKCSWNETYHQLGDANQFEFLRKGVWLTKEFSSYAYDQKSSTSDFHNTLAIQNDVPEDLATMWWATETSARGGQWTLGIDNGDPTLNVADHSGYLGLLGDATNLYNKRSTNYAQTGAAQDVAHASRSLVWFKPDHMVIYDRAVTATANRFKRFHLSLPAAPTFDATGSIATVSTLGQTLFVTNMMPSVTMTAAASENFNEIAEEEPMRYQLRSEDLARPNSARFLHVLQGADQGALRDATTYLASASGEATEGAAVGVFAVHFIKTLSDSFDTATVLPFPTASQQRLLAGLAPGSTATAVVVGTSGSDTLIQVIPGGSMTVDAGGVLDLSGVAPLSGVGDWILLD